MVAVLRRRWRSLVAILLLWSILRGILRSPEQVSLFFRHRRAMKGYLAISRGLIAIGAGDLKLARSSADEAARLSPGDPLTLLLTAQSAQMAGDRGARRARLPRHDAARRHQAARLARALYRGAAPQRPSRRAPGGRGSGQGARPSLAWAGQAVLDDRCAASDWQGALAALDHMRGALDKADYRRKRAVLLTARAQALDEIDRDGARAAVMEAVKLAPDLVPAAALAGQAAGGIERAAQGGENPGSGLEDQSASRHRRGLRQSALRRHRARSSRAHAEARRQDAGSARGRAGRRARRARCARIRRPRAMRWRLICRRRRGGSRP